MNGIWQDLKTAMRTLRRAPGFTLIAILVLAIGIGANTTIFTMVERVLLQPLPYPHANRLINIWERDTFAPPQYRYLPVNAGNFQYWEKHCPGLQHLAAIEETGMTLTGRGRPQRLKAARVTSQLFAMLGVRPYLGNFFTPAENTRGKDHEAVLTYGLWRQLFHGNPHAIGKSLQLNGAAFHVVGVLPKNFYSPGYRWLFPMKIPANGPRIQLFKPYGYLPFEMKPGEGDFNDVALAELKPGFTPAQAQAQLDVAENQIAQSTHAEGKLSVQVLPLQEAVTRRSRRGLWMLMAGAGLLLLLVCVNLANLLLARNSGRMAEMAIRGALGASRGRMLRQLATEALVLAAAGGGLGVWLAGILLPALAAQAHGGAPRLEGLNLNGPVLLFSALATLGTGILFGAGPALQLSSLAPARWIQSGGRAISASKQSLRTREWLTAAEVALSTMLLIGALLLATSLARVLRANRIFFTQRVVSLAVPNPALHNAKQFTHLFNAMLHKVKILPGVQSASFVSHLPLHGETDINGLRVQGSPFDPHHIIPLDFRHISRDYFQTAGIPLRAGAEFSAGAKNVAIIAENVARQYFRNRNPIGMYIESSGGSQHPQWARIVGVAADTRATPAQPAPLTAYFPLSNEQYFGNMQLLVRTAGPVKALQANLDRAIWSINPDIPLQPPRTLEHLVLKANRARGFQAILTGGFAICAALLAGLGLYGVIAAGVALRRREIAIRMALGATPRNIRQLVLGRLGTLVGIGLAIGLAGAWALARLLANQLYGVSATDPRVYLGAALGFAMIAALAGTLPARRAAREDPAQALHAE